MIRNIIFDWSGTLVNDLPAVLAATNHVFRQAGLPPLSLSEFRREFKLPFSRFYARFTPTIPLDQLERWFHQHFRELQDSVIEVPYARRFLEQCRDRGLRTFLLSSLHAEHFTPQARRTGFDQFIDRSYLGVWDKRVKILELLTENSLDPDQTLFIGDMEHDVETAKHGGIHSCAVLTGYSGYEQLLASAPDLLVEHLGELGRHLDGHLWTIPAPWVTPAAARFAHPVATVGALIYRDDDRVLLVRTQKWSGRWGIPGGKIRRGEAAEAALTRELLEETGLPTRDTRFLMVQDCIDSEEFYRPAHFLLLNYACRTDDPDAVQLNDEAQDFQWLTVPDALQLDINRPTRRLLDHVLSLPPWTTS